MGGNSFLVRLSGSQFILSYKLNGFIHHDIIEKNPKGYNLERKKDSFESIPDLVCHYQKVPIIDGGRQLLAHVCDKDQSSKKTYIMKRLLSTIHVSYLQRKY